jgi:ATP-binding cassette subfamily C protein
MVPEGGSGFSGGQLQRILLARALVRKPRILLLDEATSALDNETQKVVSDNLKQLGVTRIIVAHRLSTVRSADEIVVLDRGRVVERGSFDRLLEADGLFATLARRQLV